MLHPKKNHARLVQDVAKLMNQTYFFIFCGAVWYNDVEKYLSQEDVNKHAQWLLDHFVETNMVPEYVESFFLDVMIGKVPIYDEKGKILNPPKRKQLPGK